MIKIISLAPSSTEILYALGCEENLIGVTHHCNFPENVSEKKDVGTLDNINFDCIQKLKPDLILTATLFPETLHHYSGHGELYHFSPKNLHDVYENILELGTLLGKEVEAKKIVDGMKEKFDEIRACSEKHHKMVEVYAEEWQKPLMTGGNWVPEILEIAGGHNKLAPSQYPTQKVNDQQIMSYNPEMIFVHWCEQETENDVEQIKKRTNWNHMQAVRNNQVYRLHSDMLNRPGPRLSQAAEKIHEIIHAFVETNTNVPQEKSILEKQLQTITMKRFQAQTIDSEREHDKAEQKIKT